MTKKTKSQTHGRPPNSSSGAIDLTKEESNFPVITSRDFQRLNEGDPNQKQVNSYIELRDAITPSTILETDLRSLDAPDAKDYQQAIERSSEIYHEAIWETRRELVVEMNRPTLERLAKHYGISPGSECIKNHPDANDLDKGLLLARLQQFLWWDGEYLGIAPEMRKIDVEESFETAKIRTRGQQPQVTEPIESVLRYASTCKNANDSMLIQALKECIAVTCACPAIERSFALKIQHIQEQADDLKEQVRDLDEYCNDPEELVMDAHAESGELGQLISYLGKTLKKITACRKDPGDAEDDGYVRKTIADLKKATQKLQEKYSAACSLDQVRAYREQFTPGETIPKIVMDATDKWFASQFTQGLPVGSKVRMAWLHEVFHSFWIKHQSSYLTLDPGLKKLQEDNSKRGASGAAIKVDKKWRQFTTLFVEYVISTDARNSKSSPDEINELVDAFGEHLIANTTRGASDSRTVAAIRVFLSTLMANMDREGDGGSPQTIHNILHNDPSRRRRGGKFGSSAFTSLSVETVATCVEILRAGINRGQAGQEKIKGQRPKRQR